MINLLEQKAGYFIGKNFFERIGKVNFSPTFFDLKGSDVVCRKIESELELLYSEYNSILNYQSVIAISKHFDLIHRDNDVPLYYCEVKTNSVFNYYKQNPEVQIRFIKESDLKC